MKFETIYYPDEINPYWIRYNADSRISIFVMKGDVHVYKVNPDMDAVNDANLSRINSYEELAQYVSKEELTYIALKFGVITPSHEYKEALKVLKWTRSGGG